jgi:hypothetical protein
MPVRGVLGGYPAREQEQAFIGTVAHKGGQGLHGGVTAGLGQQPQAALVHERFNRGFAALALSPKGFVDQLFTERRLF